PGALAPFGQARAARGRACQILQVRSLGPVEPQGPGEGLQDGVGDAAQVTALDPRVVRGAHPGALGDLLPAQTGDPAPAAGHRQARLLGADPPTGRRQELRRISSGVHRSTVRGAAQDRNSSTSARPGAPSVPQRVTAIAAAALARVAADSQSAPRARSASSTPVWVSPAPLVSTASCGNAGISVPRP